MCGRGVGVAAAVGIGEGTNGAGDAVWLGKGRGGAGVPRKGVSVGTIAGAGVGGALHATRMTNAPKMERAAQRAHPSIILCNFISRGVVPNSLHSQLDRWQERRDDRYQRNNENDNHCHAAYQFQPS